MAAPKHVRRRFHIVKRLFIALCLLLLGRAAWVQLAPDPRLEDLQRRQYRSVLRIPARRGDILDRNGRELAVTAAAWSLAADPSQVENPKKLARWIQRKFQIPYEEALEKLSDSDRKFVWIRRRMTLAERDKLNRKLPPALRFIEESRRIYPNAHLLSQVLGFVGADGQGLEGLELSLDPMMTAKERRVSVARDARGRPLLVDGELIAEAMRGGEITLTVDRDLQFFVEQELARVSTAQNAAGATAIVLDPRNGEVLAMASAPTFNSNAALDARPELRRNRPVTDIYEPGSVMKPFIIAAALDHGRLEPNAVIDTGDGHLQIGKRVIREADEKHHFGKVSLVEALARSSNVALAKVGLLTGGEILEPFLRELGFGERLGIELPGEAKGILHSKPWNDDLTASVAFGHGVSASLLQIASAYGAIANGGILIRPTLIRSIAKSEGEAMKWNATVTSRRVMRAETASRVRMMLVAATGADATGKEAQVPGYPVAGKTGTAQRSRDGERGYEAGMYISSFAGFLPAQDPKFVIVVTVDRPQRAYYASEVAAPVFGHIGAYVARRFALPPVFIDENQLLPGTENRWTPPLRVPDPLNTAAQTGTLNPNEMVGPQFISRPVEPSRL